MVNKLIHLDTNYQTFVFQKIILADIKSQYDNKDTICRCRATNSLLILFILCTERYERDIYILLSINLHIY